MAAPAKYHAISTLSLAFSCAAVACPRGRRPGAAGPPPRRRGDRCDPRPVPAPRADGPPRRGRRPGRRCRAGCRSSGACSSGRQRQGRADHARKAGRGATRSARRGRSVRGRPRCCDDDHPPRDAACGAGARYRRVPANRQAPDRQLSVAAAQERPEAPHICRRCATCQGEAEERAAVAMRSSGAITALSPPRFHRAPTWTR